jgi:NADH-quinone oxidoreductase subunit A
MDFTNYLPVLLIIIMAVGFVIVNIVASGLLGPKRSGDVKSLTYESGMNPIGTARKRFNIRFFIVALTFLVFDIEIIFLYPWAVDFAQLAQGSSEATLFFGRILFFLGTSIFAYIYAWKKGVFRWD